MSKPVKDMVTTELKGRYGALDSALWVELVGAGGTLTNQFRRELRTKKMQLEVVKTSLLRRALSESRLAPLTREMSGPSALITGGDSVIEVAKAVEAWLPKIPGLKLKGAVLEGEYIGPNNIEQLSKMPTKADLQAKVAGVIRSPGANLAAAINSGGGRIAACIKTLIEKLEKGEPVSPAA